MTSADVGCPWHQVPRWVHNVVMLRDFEKPENPLSHAILGASIEVHKQLGPGLLEKAYEACLAHELAARKIRFIRQVPIPVTIKYIISAPHMVPDCQPEIIL